MWNYYCIDEDSNVFYTNSEQEAKDAGCDGHLVIDTRKGVASYWGEQETEIEAYTPVEEESEDEDEE